MPFERVSVSDAGVSANNDVQNVSISADGRYIVYETWADNLVAGDSNNKRDIYLYDRQLDKVELISGGMNGAASNGTSTDAVVSADGRFVAFQSDASNLVAGDTIAPGHSSLGKDVFLYDRQTGSMSRVSGNTAGVEGNHSATGPSISDDGRYVAFESLASDLVAGDTNGVKDVFVWDRVTGATTRVSVTSTGAQGSFASDSADISGDGSHIAFRSGSALTPDDVGDPGNGETDVFVYNRLNGAIELIGDRGRSPSLSADGSIIAFSSNQQLTSEVSASPGLLQVFVYDRNSEAMVLASFSTTGTQSNNSNILPDISADGRYVVFESEANNMDPADLSSTNDIYLYDRVLDTVSAITLSAPQQESYSPTISADGTLIAFHSESNFAGPAVADTQAFVGYNGVTNQAATVSLNNALTSLAENASTSSATKIADVVITDDGNGFNTLGLTGRDSASFSIVGDALYLKAGVTLDHETLSELQVAVTVDDVSIAGAPDATAAFALAVTDVNEAPTAVTLSSTTPALAENTSTASRIKVADIAVTDDALGTNVLGLTGTDAGFFEIIGSALYLKAGTVLNVEAKPSYAVAVTVDDASLGATPDATSATYTLAVTNINEAPTAVTLSNTTAALVENTSTASRIKVADIAVTDDALGTNVLGLTGTDAGFFEIIGSALYLKAGTVLNFETKSNYAVAVTVDDTAVGSTPDATSSTYTLAVTNVNEAPTDFALSSSSVLEFRANGTVVGTLSATDPDASDTFTYTLLDSAGGRFAIVGDQLRVANGLLLDREQAASHAVSVRVTDSGGLTFTKTLNISVADVNPENVTGNASANTLFGGAGADTFNGNGGNDRLFGQGGNDSLLGGSGNDTLTGGTGRDIMTGGAGSDDFDFNSITETGKTSATRDVIKDFTHLSDDIDLRDIDANGSAAGNTAFKFLAVKGAAFTGVKGQLKWSQINAAGTANDKTIIEGDVNGDKRADFHIELTGLKTLTASDFIL